MKTWLISDTHFGHENILTFTTSTGLLRGRDFSSVADMDETMIRNWNMTVAPDDKIYHLGDVAICKWSLLESILRRLNGRKILIKGNHDRLKLSQYAQYFADVRSYHILDGILLAHIPIHPESLSRWKGQVHGHLHSGFVKDPRWDTQPDTRYLNISVERINYIPINWEEVRAYFERQESKKT